MNTLKSAALLIVLLGVLYGVYVALNKPELPGFGAPPAGSDIAPPLIEGPDSVSFPSAAGGSAYSQGPEAESPAGAYGGRAVRGGSYPSNVDAASLPPPPTTVPAAPAPLAPNTSPGGGLARSTYEAQATSPASEAVSTASANQAPPLEMTPVSRAASEAAAAAPALAVYALRNDMAEAEQMVSAGKFKSALAKLSPHHAKSDLPAEQRTALFAWLDGLAAKVVYSREHLLAAPHTVRRGETLYDVAHQYNIEYRLLQKINHEVSDPLILVPATELKVVPGPFDMDVNLTTGEMTLLVNDLYAGRFGFVVGDQPPQPGEYRVLDKRSQQKTYVGFDGRMIPANDPSNPYGGWWISLGGEVAIHGSPASPGDKTLGCISLSPQDARDVYGIVSIGSGVKIRR